MAGMLRCKDEEEFKRLVARGSLRVRSDTSRRAAKVQVSPKGAGPTRATGEDAFDSDIERLFAGQISAAGNLPEYKPHYPYLRGRKHTVDFAWPDWTVNGWQFGVAVQGMCHRTKERFLGDIEAKALAQQQGWLILDVAGEYIRNGKAMEWLQELFKRAVRKAP